MNLQILNPFDHPDYDEMVLAAGGSFFHTSSWARVLHGSYGYRPCYLAGIRGGRLDVLAPMMEVTSFLTGNRGVSLPFTDLCEPIVNDAGLWPDVFAHLKEYGKGAKWKYLELRGGERLLGQAPCSSSYFRHDLALSADIDALYAGVKGSTKRNIRKAAREAVTVARAASLDAIRTFYDLHCRTRKKHGLPPQPFHFFQGLYDHVISKDRGEVFLARHKGRAIGGAVYLHFGGEAIYKFGASDPRYLHLRPNDIVMWAAIQWYCAKGHRSFCFGRTDADNEGLRSFKYGWGAKERVLKYHRYDLIKNAYVTESPQGQGFYNKVFSGMPVPVLKLTGSLLYRHMG